MTIFGHKEFVAYTLEINSLLDKWIAKSTAYLSKQTKGLLPKKVIAHISEDILSTFENKALLENYNVYQHLMNYWSATMQDDCYLINADGWKAEPYRIIVENKQGKKIDKGWACDLLPVEIIIKKYFKEDKEVLEKLETQKESYATQLQELEEEHNTEDGYFADFEKVNKANVQKRLKELSTLKLKNTKKNLKEDYSMVAESETPYGEVSLLEKYLELTEKQSILNAEIKEATELLDQKALAKYQKLKEADIKELVIKDKWMLAIQQAIQAEMEAISQTLAQRINELATRYEKPLPQLTKQLADLEEKVNAHLFKMGFEWE
jgi:type I restriction enzyme M protein